MFKFVSSSQAYSIRYAFTSCLVDRKSCPERSRMGGDISHYLQQEAFGLPGNSKRLRKRFVSGSGAQFLTP
jgi:hypothetical protein